MINQHSEFPTDLATLVDVLRWRAHLQPMQHAYTFLTDGETTEVHLTYAALEQRARAIGAHLDHLRIPGERALLLYPPGLEYIAAFFGCLYAGVAAIPAYPPDPLRLDRTLPRLHAIVQDACPAVVLTTAPIVSIAEVLIRQAPDFQSTNWIATDTIADDVALPWHPPRLSRDVLAFLQYTSGSTASPKGVMLSHGNLLHNLELIQTCFAHTPESRGVIWLPPYHDMGLIGGILQPLYSGFPVTLMSPIDFLQRPLRWLQAVTRYEATTSGGPNFAYDLCVRKISAEQRASLDLSNWQVAFNGAEPIRHDTIERFVAAFAPCGFRPTAFYPCYGLAEATLIVSGGTAAAQPIARSFEAGALERHHVVETAAPRQCDSTLIGCGRTLTHQQIVIVDPETSTRCPADRVGEIWVTGPSVAQGYWNQAEETAATFQAYLADGDAGPFLRTGDLGFLWEGELFITGRLKDLIIIRGRNHYPQDLERTVEQSHPALRPGGGAAFAIDVDGEERLVIVQEVERQARNPDVVALAEAIRQAVAQQHELHVHAIVLVKAGSIPKTSSGKIQRHACHTAFIAGGLDVLGSSIREEFADEATSDPLTQETFLALPLGEHLPRLETHLRALIARVLRIAPARLDVRQPLISLGLDSLMAVEVQHSIERSLDVVVPMADILGGANIAQLAAHVYSALSAPPTPVDTPAAPRTKQSEHPLSHGQRALWFLHRLAPESAAYTIACAARIRMELDIPALQRALQTLIAHHPPLRATIAASESTPILHIHDQAESWLHVEDATGDEAALSQGLVEEAHRPFDLECGPLLRVYLFTQSAHEYVLLLAVHHIVADFWSLTLLARQLGILYTAYTAGRPALLDPPAWQYADYVCWQNDLLLGPQGEQLWSYWEQQLAALPTLDLSTDRPRPPIQTYQGAEHTVLLDQGVTRDLKAFGEGHGVTLATALFAAFSVVLFRYSGQDDILLGTVTAGRSRAALADSVGYFVNPLVIRADLSGDPPAQTVLDRVHQTALAAFAHQDYPFGLLVERLQPARDPSRTPFFQVMVILQQAPPLAPEGITAFALGLPGSQLELGALTLEAMALERRAAQFDLTLVAAEVGGRLGFVLQYNRDLFDLATIARMAGHLRAVLEGLITWPECRIAHLPLLTAAEQHQILVAWNATHIDAAQQMSIPRLVEAQVARTPEAIAVVYRDAHLTYRELNRRANQLARHLHQLGVAPEALVGICLERSAELLIGLLGVLKAGGAYIPLDPTYPPERLAFMLDDAQVTVLITTNRSQGSGSGGQDGAGLRTDPWPPTSDLWTVVDLHVDWPLIARQPAIEPTSDVHPENLAYVIYTSGSTGRPKGVMVGHGNVVNFCMAMDRQLGSDPPGTWLAVTSISFDISVLELVWTLRHGFRVVVQQENDAYSIGLRHVSNGADQSDSGRVSQLEYALTAQLLRQRVTHMQCTPSLASMLLVDPATRAALASLQRLLIGGEALPLHLAIQLRAALPGAISNMYGPTETTIWSTTQPVDRMEGPIAIGRPIANTAIYILDRALEPTPVGVAGELYIGGAGVVRGYLGRPDLTADRFVPNPFSQGSGIRGQESGRTDHAPDPRPLTPDSRLYRTGDLARYCSDGMITFLGRQDYQIKIRGHRIELGEIEAVLGQHPAVRQAVVVARADGMPAGGDTDQRLIAYVVPTMDEGRTTNDEGGDSSFVVRPSSVVSELRGFLQGHLPAAMLPAAIVVLNALPLTPNGKIDRRALPAPAIAQLVTDATFAAPRTPTEELLAQIWTTVLGLPRVGIYDNFFALGGHSLLAMQVLARVRAIFQAEVALRSFFAAPSVAGLAEQIELSRPRSVPDMRPPLRPVPRSEDLPLSFAQQRLWFLDQLEPDSPLYNLSAAVQLKGGLNLAALRQTLDELMRRHEVLRTTFVDHGGQPLQRIASHHVLPLPLVDLRVWPATDRQAALRRCLAAETQRPFDLARDTLLRTTLLQLDEAEYIMLVIMHHIVSDGWSMGVLIREMAALYTAFSQGTLAALAPLPIQYADFAHWQRHWLHGAPLHAQLAYWHSQLAGAPTVLEIPTDHPRPPIQSFHGANHAFNLSPILNTALRALSNREGVTLFMVLLAAFATLLFRYSGQADVLVGSPIANRTWAEIEGLIGFFVNTLVLRTNLAGHPSFRELLARVRDVTLSAYAHQDLPFEKLVEELRPERDLSRQPLFQVMFVLQNAPMPHLELPQLMIEQLLLESPTAKFDLTFFMEETTRGLQGVVEYNTDLFEATTIARMAQHFQVLLSGAAANLAHPIAILPLLAPAEREQLLTEWNDTRTSSADDHCVHGLFAAQTAQTPDAVALVFDQTINDEARRMKHNASPFTVDHSSFHAQHLTYAELERRANLLAHYLRARGVASDVLVGICMERSVELVIALVGVLKAGGAYVPLDPAYPPSRLSFMLEDSRATVLITTNRDQRSAIGGQDGAGPRTDPWPPPPDPWTMVDLHVDWPRIAQAPEHDPSAGVTAASLAYVIYTSGSTGRPKGVQIPHGALTNFLGAIRRRVGLTKHDMLLSVTTLAFDIAGLELYLPLTIGACVSMVPRQVAADGTMLLTILEQSGATMMQATPATWRLLLEAGWQGRRPLNILCGGEALPQELADRLRERSLSFWNLYGPTETTIWSTMQRIAACDPIVRIGHPIANTQIYLLDAQLQPVPIGVVAELYIGGGGLARGYLGRPELTAERFIPNPFSQGSRIRGPGSGRTDHAPDPRPLTPDLRLYRTGDLARYLPDGTIAYLGRIDQQIKLRGYRIELGEIEAVLGQHPAVQQSVVAARADVSGGSRLVAYLVQDPAYRMEQAASQDWQVEQVAQWRAAWDAIYSHPATHVDPTFNIRGWNSSFTGQPIPDAEMREWVERTVERIRSLQLRRVLEIGCGTGLLLSRIAPDCVEYWGTDASPSALRYLEQYLPIMRAAHSRIVLLQRMADQFADLPAETFDTVILNSVAQYFPGVDYLLRVIEGVVRLVRPGGAIFIGDVRSLPLLRAFHTAVQLYQAPDALPRADLRQRVEELIAREEELVIDPAFFHALQQRLPQIRHVQVLLKRGYHHNEITCFRYDVLIRVGAPAILSTEIAWLDWQARGWDRAALRHHLTELAPDRLGIRQVPNARILAALKGAAQLNQVDDAATAGDIRAALQAETAAGVDPEDMWALSAELPYTVALTWSGDQAPGCYDVLFDRRTTTVTGDNAAGPLLPPPAALTDERIRPWSDYTNNPLHGKFAQWLMPQLRHYLHERLPEYMLPSTFVLLDALPLTPNGKIDRRALPAPDGSRPDLNRAFTAPRTQLEQELAAIWAEVLGIERIGIHDNFFALGGHSLLGTQVISRVRAALTIELPLRSLFEAPTVAQLAAHIAQARETASDTQAPPLRPIMRAGALPLSFAQERMWFLDQLAASTPGYNMPGAIRLAGTLDLIALARGLANLMRRHETLRTTFPTVDGQPMAIIASRPTVSLPLLELKGLPEPLPAELARRLADMEARQPFDLAQGPLLRTTLLRLDADAHLLLLTLHHIIADNWSIGILIRELAACYTAAVIGTPAHLADLPIQYIDFAYWQRQWLRGSVLEAQLAYWRSHLAGAPQVLDLPTDRPRPPVQTFHGALHSFQLPAPLVSVVSALSRSCDVTTFMTLLAAFNLLLARYTGRQDILVGSPIANRNRTEIEGLIGLFFNTLVLRTDLSGNPTVQELLSRMRAVCLSAYAHQDLPFEKLVEALRPERSVTHTALFQVLFDLHNPPPAEPIALPDLTLIWSAGATETARFDLALTMEETPQGFAGMIEYNTDLFDAATIARLASHLQTLLTGMVAAPTGIISELPLLTKAERQELLGTRNATRTAYPQNMCFHQLFEAQADRTPTAIAVIYEGEQLSYATLNARANQLAHKLRACGVGPQVRVGICMERSVELVIGLLGIFKAGGAFMPLDPAFPRERMAFMLADAQVNVLLTQARLLDRLPAYSGEVICLDRDWQQIAHAPANNGTSGATAEHLAYVIYTSGSTGHPKGVMIAHRGLLNYLVWCAEAYGVARGRAAPVQSSIAADAIFPSLFAPLLAGTSVLLLPEHGALEALGDELRTHGQFSMIKITPSQLEVLNQQLPQEAGDGWVRTLVVGAEALRGEVLAFWQSYAPATRLLNEYGPTETVVGCSIYEIPAGQAIAGGVPIGLPIANIQFYVLDAQLQLVPIGVPGELYIGGDGVAWGYLGRPDLTAERFVPNPFLKDEGGRWKDEEAPFILPPSSFRLYKTGDLVRYLDDRAANIEFLGRVDDQVKIRGYRVEPGEIEALLGRHPAVREVVVLARAYAPGDRRLVAYVVPLERSGARGLGPAETRPLVDDLRDFLKQHVPDYMLPSAFVLLDAIPLAPHGKVDRKALPAPDAARPDLKINFVAPRTAAEATLAIIWSQVLGLDQVGIDDNFFALGGDSILSIQIIARANQAGLRLTPRTIFQHQTIAKLAAAAKPSHAAQAEQGLVIGAVPLTPIQRWFFAQDLPEPYHYNQAVSLAARRSLDPALLRRAVRHLLLHHDALRLRFRYTDSGWEQAGVRFDGAVPFTHIDISALPKSRHQTALELLAAGVHASLGLTNGPLLRAILCFSDASRSRLLLVVHHLAVDGVSWRILLEDLQTAYLQLSHDAAIHLSAKTTSYQQWSQRLTQYAQSVELAHELDYWLARLWMATVHLPVDNPVGQNSEAVAQRVFVDLTHAETQDLLQVVPKAYHSQIAEVLLTALAWSLEQWTGTSVLAVDIEGHGRGQLFDDLDLSRTVGWLTVVFPIYLDLRGTNDLRTVLSAVTEQVRQIPNQGVGYGLLRYLSPDSERTARLRALPPPEISFNYLGQFDQLQRESALFERMAEAIGPLRSLHGRRSHLIEINGFVADGQLRLEWIYSEQVHRRATIERVAGQFIAALRQLIVQGQAIDASAGAPPDFPLVQLDRSLLERTLANLPPLDDIYPVAPLQEEMLAHTCAAPRSGVYVVQLICAFRGQFRLALFQHAWQHVLERHPILRTAFIWAGVPEPLQVVYRAAALPWRQDDWQALSPDQQQQRLEAHLMEDRQSGFELSTAPLMRLALIQMAADTYQFIWSYHHLLLDGWSIAPLLRDVFNCYAALSQRQPIQLGPTHPYREYIAWRQRQDLAGAENFWRTALKGLRTPPRIGTAPRHLLETAEPYAEQEITLAAAATSTLQLLARQQQLTLNTFLQGTWALLLSQYSGADDVIFGMVVASRPAELAGVEAIIGPLINLLPVRVRVARHINLLPWLKQLQEQQRALLQYEYSSLAQIRTWSGIPDSLPLFETVLRFQNYPLDSTVLHDNQALAIDSIRWIDHWHHPINLIIVPGPALALRITYDRRYIGSDMVAQVLACFRSIVEGMGDHLDRTLAEILKRNTSTGSNGFTMIGNGSVDEVHP